MNRVVLHADGNIEYLGATLQSTSTAVSTITSCFARLYDDDEDLVLGIRSEILTDDAAAAATTLKFVTARYATGDTVEIELDDGTIHKTTITVDDAATATLAVGIPTAAAKGVVVARRFHAIGATVLEVTPRTGTIYEIDDAIEVRQDDGTRHETTIADRHRDWIEPAVGLTVAGTCGRRVARKLGADISMTLFGTPTADLEDGSWGYRGALLPSHAGLEKGQRLRIEITLIDTPGNVVLDQTLRAIVMGDG